MSDPTTQVHRVSIVFRNLTNAVDDAYLWLLFAMVGGAGASVLAIGILLRSGRRVHMRVLVGTLLHSMAWGAGVFLMLADQTAMSVPVMLGVAIFSGMGLASFLDVVVLVLRRQLGLPPPRDVTTKEP